MKLNARDAARFLAKPDLSKAGVLLFGPDAMRIALKRQDVVATLVGPEGENEMRLTRMSGAELRKDPARLLDAIKAQGFFPGQRVVLVEEATDGLSKFFLAAIQDWLPGDAMMVVTAGQLNARSALRKAFEGSGSCVAIGIYTDPPTRDEIEATLKKSGIASIDPDAVTDLDNLSRQLDLGAHARRLAVTDDFHAQHTVVAWIQTDHDHDVAAVAAVTGRFDGKTRYFAVLAQIKHRVGLVPHRNSQLLGKQPLGWLLEQPFQGRSAHIEILLHLDAAGQTRAHVGQGRRTQGANDSQHKNQVSNLTQRPAPPDPLPMVLCGPVTDCRNCSTGLRRSRRRHEPKTCG